MRKMKMATGTLHSHPETKGNKELGLSVAKKTAVPHLTGTPAPSSVPKLPAHTILESEVQSQPCQLKPSQNQKPGSGLSA